MHFLIARPADILKAQELRSSRDARYGNIYSEKPTDMRWVGDLGELLFSKWLQAQNLCVTHLNGIEAAGEPDFEVNGISIDLKTVKRKLPPLPHYTAQITDKHAKKPVDQFFFCSYEPAHRRLWLLGGIAFQDFLDQATYYGPGAKVHDNYTVRQGHAIYNLPIAQLTPPSSWTACLSMPPYPQKNHATNRGSAT